MPANFGYAATPPGIVKVVNIVFGAITVGCVARAWEGDLVFERLLFGASIAFFAASFLYLLGYLIVKRLELSKINVGLDILYHVAGAIILITAGSLMIHSARDNKRDDSPPEGWDVKIPPYQQKLAAGSFGIINGIFYIIAGVLALTRNPTEDMPEPEPRYKP